MALRSIHSRQPAGTSTSLVWCFEHCHKAEHRHTRAELADLASQYGFDFLCHKKCMGFMSWLRGSTGSVLLVAEWREAKPIMEELDNWNDIPDFHMCVVARAKKMYDRACAWAERQSRSKRIVVSLGFSREMVEELIPAPPQATRSLSGESNDDHAPVWFWPVQPSFPEPFHWVSL